jgi:hypothetical protein
MPPSSCSSGAWLGAAWCPCSRGNTRCTLGAGLCAMACVRLASCQSGYFSTRRSPSE